MRGSWMTEYELKARQQLGDILPADEPLWDPRIANDAVVRIDLPSLQFPVPTLILFGLGYLRGLTWWGPEEKLRWGIVASRHGHDFAVTYEKFGMRLYVSRDQSEELTSAIIGKLIAAARLGEACLSVLARHQIDAGNVTIENQYRYFDGAYTFFREKARAAYDSPPPESVKHYNAQGEISGSSWEPMRFQLEGGYLAGAMVDAYFSRLEHLFVLVLPFLDFDPTGGKLVEFVGRTWDTKWRSVFDVADDRFAKSNYDKLHAIKEVVRNPISHGGFMKKGTSFYFHVPTIGALPALLTRHGKTCELTVTRVPKNTYEELCSDLDRCDEFLWASRIGSAVRYAEAGLDVAFSARFRSECQAAAASEDTLEAFMDHQAAQSDRHANMDY
jgi:hypothetical protein